MYRNCVIAFIMLFALAGCSYFAGEDEKDAVARVGDHFLYPRDLAGIYGENMSAEDSAVVRNNFVNSWALRQLVMEKAEMNLPEEQLREFEKLIEEYKIDLYTNTYKEALVNSAMDTAITNSEITSFYGMRKDNFRLNEELWQFRYIELSPDFGKLDDVREKFERFEPEDRESLEEMAIQFKSYSLEDTIWAKKTQILRKIPVLALEEHENKIKKSHFIELEDSLGVYLVYINDILERNDTAPISYVKPTIKQILLNKKKLDFVRNTEREIVEEALSKKKFEIYGSDK
ncbi:peptidyl-prolyl cis-trans isomerase [Sinomicrobium soli]|uniref:peptidyl-prolyl cis-trans isomerase n=1 Tax=Sinomicrobium sp. N-1-3-6 TaxID=2219864 RepID=UPI000DCC1690|nr:peptidyl-prolyl cis-trans isomerase [Sinomicrobium sp. N-1-3-6]RAV30607.1 peptidyl-prolyl cis-trans isomerase [Sinomicrobium sp. N-1-3-6]